MANIHYPDRARKAGIEGQVWVEFVVDKHGNAVDPHVVRGIGGGCDEAAIEAVKKAKFIPVMLHGRPVKVRYSLPIVFKLQLQATSHRTAKPSLSTLSFATVQRQAHAGDARAEINLGTRYYTGNGVTQDYRQALAWYRRAASQGEADAENNIGWMYQHGNGVMQDYWQALMWYRKAASQGEADAENNIGWMYRYGYGVPRDYGQALMWYRRAAAQGEANAENNIGWMYQNGLGVTQNYWQALMWYRKAAAQSEADAENNLGNMYYNGLGVTQDYRQALAWYRKAAAQSEAYAENALGNMYYSGLGVTQDFRQALMWYRKAAAQGITAAKQSLANLRQQIAAERQSALSTVRYSRNKPSDANCGNWTPSSAEVTFSIKSVKNTDGQGPEDVEFSMHNSSGCQVVVDAIGKVTGSKGDTYTTDTTPGQPASLEFKGFEDRRQFTPFSTMVAPDVQEYPKMAEIESIEACSATPPSNYPNGSYFDPFRDGKCTRFSDFGPIAFKTPGNPACNQISSTEWMNSKKIPDNPSIPRTGHTYESVQVKGTTGLVIYDRYTDGTAQVRTDIPFDDIGALHFNGQSIVGSYWAWSVDVTPLRQPFHVTYGNGKSFDQDPTIPISILFPSQVEARQAYNYLLCHVPNAKH